MNAISTGLTSWKTTLFGLLGAIFIALQSVDHLTWQTVLGAVSVAAVGFFSKDSNVTSEQAGLK